MYSPFWLKDGRPLSSASSIFAGSHVAVASRIPKGPPPGLRDGVKIP
jgi:hypothetical protein